MKTRRRQTRPRRVPEAVARRRRAALIEAGVGQMELARAVDPPLSQQGVANALGGYFTTADLRLEREFVRRVRQGLRDAGYPDRADQMTLEYFGWDADEKKSSAEAGHPMKPERRR
jgi:hypothetical protein